MATVTDIGLAFCEQTALRLRLMYGMTGSADYVGLRVIAAANVSAVRIFCMAAEARLQGLARG